MMPNAPRIYEDEEEKAAMALANPKLIKGRWMVCCVLGGYPFPFERGRENPMAQQHQHQPQPIYTSLSYITI